jgi:HD-GYP domain-containing protein (c-di-GMP phosphodiesterase class II)
MTTDRPYRCAMPYAEARAEIAQNAGTQFDPNIVERFLSIPERRWVSLREGLTP